MSPCRTPSSTAFERRRRDRLDGRLRRLVAAFGRGPLMAQTSEKGAWRQARIPYGITLEACSEATSRHFLEPTASALRTPWRFTSSHPHSQIRRLRCPIRARTSECCFQTSSSGLGSTSLAGRAGGTNPRRRVKMTVLHAELCKVTGDVQHHADAAGVAHACSWRRRAGAAVRAAPALSPVTASCEA